MSRNLIARLCVAAVAIPAILWISYQGGWWLFGMVSLFALVAIGEFLVAEGCRPSSILFWLALILVMSIWLSIAITIDPDAKIDKLSLLLPFTLPPLFVGFFLISGMLLAIGKESPADLFHRHARLCWGALYVGLLYLFVFMVGYRGTAAAGTSGGDELLFLFGLLWVGDTTAMWIGSAFGKHKLAPTVSPNKTVEGFIGGIFGALAIGVLMIFWKFSMVPWYHVVALAVGCSVFGQLGDLVESMWKRSLGIKDSSALIPGHGGILDRFDSLLFAAPFMFFYMMFVMA
jgi:phosphatidate cytidylyltransferase